ncbi:hypothetical protein AB6A40_006121 [Gnathostoma spinigerum]|uniref:Uncharacterized protein n=1 Tax=Gnathostoma spinigerum TaxID=75299 RepID=A0ABD6ERT8_9BILA
MAPEAMHCDTSVTRSVDIFSLGCIYYYVLSNGVHPFGDSFNRQGNIMRGTYSLKTLLLTGNFTGVDVIESMLQRDVLKRPTATELCAHPFFWSKERQLQFFLDVSDRIEKESEMDIIVRRLEKNNRGVVANNWRQVICPALAEDLRKFRTYKGTSVRDLLRAMRNKKHHYRELPENVRSSLGCVPDEFVTYFTSRFPQLLMHTYKALAACANEPVFSGYYSEHDRRRAAMLGDYTADSSADEWTPCANGGNRINRITFKNGIECLEEL